MVKNNCFLYHSLSVGENEPAENMACISDLQNQSSWKIQKCLRKLLIMKVNRLKALNRYDFFFNRDLNRGCLAYMFSLRFLRSTFLINLRRGLRVRKIFRTQVFAGFAFFSFCV